MNHTGGGVCIIGAGLAGSLIAYKLTAAGIPVVLLEAGPRYTSNDLERKTKDLKRDPWPWDLRSDDPAFERYDDRSPIAYPVTESTVKAVGGSTQAWLGTALRLHSSDFRMKTQFGVAVDWPIGYDDLAEFYLEAEQELGVAGRDDNPWQRRNDQEYPLPPFGYSRSEEIFIAACSKLGIATHTTPQARNSLPYQGRQACENHASCIPLCPTRAKYSADYHVMLAEQTNLLTLKPQHSVVKLMASGGRVTEAWCFSDGELKCQGADLFIVCANAIETVRLLKLSSSASFSRGLCDSSGLLGSHFMDHPVIWAEGIVGEFLPARGFQTLQSHQFYVTRQRDHIAAFKLEFSTTPQFSWQLGDSMVNRRSWLKIIALIEMLPAEKNRVALSEGLTDNRDTPSASTQLELSDYESSAVDLAGDICRRILETAGAKRIEVSSPFWGAAHPSGTCRMSSEPGNGVVDPNLCSHDLQNLYIVGSSVFPTIGAANPSLTIAALALRLASYIRANM